MRKNGSTHISCMCTFSCIKIYIAKHHLPLVKILTVARDRRGDRAMSKNKKKKKEQDSVSAYACAYTSMCICFDPCCCVHVCVEVAVCLWKGGDLDLTDSNA